MPHDHMGEIAKIPLEVLINLRIIRICYHIGCDEQDFLTLSSPLTLVPEERVRNPYGQEYRFFLEKRWLDLVKVVVSLAEPEPILDALNSVAEPSAIHVFKD